MNIVDQLKEYMKRENIKLPKVAELTDIPYDRLYQWIKGKSSPKVEDTTILENLISGKKSNIIQEDPAFYTTGNLLGQQKNCMDALTRALEVIQSQQRTIESLINNQGQVRANAG